MLVTQGLLEPEYRLWDSILVYSSVEYPVDSEKQWGKLYFPGQFKKISAVLQGVLRAPLCVFRSVRFCRLAETGKDEQR